VQYLCSSECFVCEKREDSAANLLMQGSLFLERTTCSQGHEPWFNDVFETAVLVF